MENELNERISSSSEKELFDILNNKKGYQEQAFDTAIKELKKRGYSEKVNSVIQEYEELEREEKLEFEKQQNLPELYSQTAIVIFSVFFTAICGAIMMAYNFRKLGNTEKSKSVLIFGIVYALSFMILSNLPDLDMIRWVLQIGAIIGGVVIVLIFEKYYPTDLKHRNKAIWKILIYALLISLSLSAVLLYFFMKNNSRLIPFFQ